MAATRLLGIRLMRDLRAVSRRLVAGGLVLVPAILLVSSALADEGTSAQTEAAREATRRGARALERGALVEALRALESAHTARPDLANTARNLALAHARTGSLALAAGDYETAETAFERALELHPGRILYRGLLARTQLYLGEHGRALREAMALARDAPEHGDVQALLSEIHERLGQLPDALEALEAAARLRPWDRRLVVRLERLRKDAKAQSEYTTVASGNFVVRYGPDVDANAATLALELLEEAFRRVVSDLGMRPRTVAQVVLYAGASFRSVTGAHGWVGALYHKGTLRVPVRQLEKHRADAARILAHEFTHHLLREQTPRLGLFWHEGIAQYMEDLEGAPRRVQAVNRALQPLASRGALLSWQAVRQMTVANESNSALASRYYQQALSFVGYLADTHGLGRITSYVLALADLKDADKASQRVFGVSESELFKAWQASLRS